jgi:hypothetical protein
MRTRLFWLINIQSGRGATSAHLYIKLPPGKSNDTQRIQKISVLGKIHKLVKKRWSRTESIKASFTLKKKKMAKNGN